ncbi:nuclear factor 7, ovary-like [Betta splendens]|uniref:Nuclear factor 7, ovary-like n=1 Tax=Betta splendens TaxID=158456 RepID=A0A6P7ML79_BETSP|nr:nuclear factor 7, ovary-like [Betta splendens]
MAFQAEEDLTCPICQEIFTEPLVLSCSHSFCRECLFTWWTGKPVQECPVCKRRSSRSEPPRNLALKNLCEALVLERQRSAAAGERLCALHGEKLQLFCLEHQQPACLVCRDSRTHLQHTFRPVHEFAQEHRTRLHGALRPLREKLQLLEQLKGNASQTAEHVKVQATRAEAAIRDQFRRFHEFLQEEEEARIAALREEEEQKSLVMKEQIEALNREISALSDTIRATEEELREDDLVLLQSCKAAGKRAQQRPPLAEHEPLIGALVDVAKHVGNLTFRVWNKMKTLVSYFPVVLDPNTANPEFVLSEDLTVMRHGERQKLPENPERIDYHRSVRGWEALAAGTHSWDVEVGHNAAWFVGVAAESVQKKGRVKSGFWQVEFFNGKYCARWLGDAPAALRVKKRLQRIRVHMDWSRGRLSFSDPDSGTHVHTFTHAFTEKLFPCLGTLDEQPLRILQGKISVTRESS